MSDLFTENEIEDLEYVRHLRKEAARALVSEEDAFTGPNGETLLTLLSGIERSAMQKAQLRHRSKSDDKANSNVDKYVALLKSVSLTPKGIVGNNIPLVESLPDELDVEPVPGECSTGIDEGLIEKFIPQD